MSCRETTRAPAFQKHWQESQYLWQSVSLPTFSQSSSLSPSLWSSLCSEKKKGKLISMQMEWEPAAQRPSGIANISSLPGSLVLLLLSYYPFSFILSSSFTFFLFLALLLSHLRCCLCWPSILPSVIWSFKSFTQQKNIFTQFCTALKPLTTSALQSKITLLQS